MLAEPAVQRELLHLAELDSNMARVKHAAKSLPQHEAIASLMGERQQVADALTAAMTNVDDLEVAGRRAEADLVPVRARLERDQERLNSGAVTDGKALQSLMDEIEHLKKRISSLEDAQLEVMGHTEEAIAARDQLAERKIAVERELREQVTARDTAVAGLKEEAIQLAQARSAVAPKLPGALLELYEKIRSASGIGAAALSRGQCGGCRLQLNVEELSDLQAAPANEVLRCPECDRIIVRDTEC